MERRKGTRIDQMERKDYSMTKPYMAVADMATYPRLSQMDSYLGTREHFAVILSYVADLDKHLDLTVNECYANQTVGVYGGMYVVGTDTAKGFFVQGTAESAIMADSRDFTLIRKL